MKHITLLDGGFGSGLWKLSEENGTPKMASWLYNVHYPEYVKTIHRRMIEAGSKIIQANTFSTNRLLENGQTVYESTPEQFAEQIAPAFDFVSYVGGCCGTDENYIREMKKSLSEL